MIYTSISLFVCRKCLAGKTFNYIQSWSICFMLSSRVTPSFVQAELLSGTFLPHLCVLTPATVSLLRLDLPNPPGFWKTAFFNSILFSRLLLLFSFFSIYQTRFWREDIPPAKNKLQPTPAFSCQTKTRFTVRDFKSDHSQMLFRFSNESWSRSLDFNRLTFWICNLRWTFLFCQKYWTIPRPQIRKGVNSAVEWRYFFFSSQFLEGTQFEISYWWNVIFNKSFSLSYEMKFCSKNMCQSRQERRQKCKRVLQTQVLPFFLNFQLVSIAHLHTLLVACHFHKQLKMQKPIKKLCIDAERELCTVLIL